ncbi:GTP-binding protein [Azospirillum sp. RWY-5-1]|uniref:GTP-binding protein n=1 Tax=Azospirillum oleiclasticum TaxID=2735135 RepID=A0ABX2TMT7_9PROT|nr:GTP-binding protein [Azospirillum oleiclasticum]NYZ24335.1 GTP-binding protein [Azospirillum oleiclasticum]
MTIALTVIGGFLGAGKTTLLNRVLQGRHGRRVMVLVNDFGSINIDAELIAGRQGRTLELKNGCACCTVGGDLMAALLDLQRRPDRPDDLIIEASGVSDPMRIAEIGLADPDYRLNAVVVVVDAERVRALAADRYMGDTVLRQLAAADLLVLGKLDLIDEAQGDAVRAWLKATVPHVRMVPSRYGAVAEEILFLDADHPKTADHVHGHAPHADFATWSAETSRPIDRGRFAEAMAALPPGVVRAKGVLRFADDDSTRPAVFHMVGRRMSIEPLAEPADTQPGSRLVAIGIPGALGPDGLWPLLNEALR